jgi:phage-related protein
MPELAGTGESRMRPLHWIGSCLKDVKALPEEVRREVGYSLHLAQLGDKAVNAVPMVGFGGAKVLEVIIDDDGDTYRAVYTVKFARAVYALHVFQKKSKRGVETPKHELDLIRHRLKTAESHYKATYEQVHRKEASHDRGA